MEFAYEFNPMTKHTYGGGDLQYLWYQNSEPQNETNMAKN